MSEPSNKKKEGRVLLPNHVVPIRYDLDLTPDMDKFTFTGMTTITMKTAADIPAEHASSISLHSKELLYQKAEYTVVEGGDVDDKAPVAAEEISVHLKKTTVTISFAKPLPKSATIKVVIHYSGFLNNQMAGFYRSTYTDVITGKQKIVASTQFEALDARRAFPCVDEPAAKAVFGVTLTVPSHLTCFSNMPEESRVTNKVEESNATPTVTICFLDSPKMSTYLLAFCVGEFDFVQAQTQHGVLVKVYAPCGRSISGKYALDCAVRSLNAYDDFFGVPYPLPKLDMVAIPEFAMGAMENWGLVTYRDVDLLIDPVTASNSQKQRVCSVVCHELAHQWFGNLVTMEWWDDLWLNEGFASWAENWSSDLLFPDYKMWDQFVTGHLSTALKLDGLQSSHPIQVPIGHAEEVEQVFDAISYCKGGSVVRMIRAVLGMKNFQAGLANYMKDHAYGNTETYHLWQAWEKVAGMPVQELMASWTEQMGFPLLKVISEDWQDDKVTLEVEQSWFLADGSTPATDADKLWTIPILTCTSAGTQADMSIMREKTAKVTVPLTGKDDWVKLNAGQEIPMRVLGTPEMHSRLAKGIESKKLSPADRVGLVMDSFALVKAGNSKPEDLLKLMASYSKEDNTIVWQGLTDALGGLDAIISDDEAMYANFREFARKLVLPLVDLVGWEASDQDEHLTTLLRGNMVSLLKTFCYEDEAIVAEATKRCKAFLEDPTDIKSLPNDIKSPVLQIYLKNGGEEEYEALKAYFYKAKDNAEKKHVLNSLGATPDTKRKLATMDWTTSGEVKLQDFFYTMGSVSRSSKEGREIAWQYLQDHFDRLQAMLAKASPSLMSAVVVMCAGGFCSIEMADKIDAFFTEHPLPNSSRRISQMTENMRANGKFLVALQSSDLSKAEFWTSLF